ncbi:phosphorylase B kinase alpha regulatory chain, putative [Brugia malayi]|uniref:Phosphorylase b kinase regulatory subunit n=1 Tax=Brugia malayi TaxID=6279 RepID=A0A4E9F0K7_BRUMA|nr:phosphorylase B kinase alpha regulatory chain, putative [Brugia malayi]VIO90140.1 phosphorylase B kinase alpha regulatory chain, putative [Brugia malayi]
MRSRSGSSVRLDCLMHLVEETILKYQNPVTGLFTNDIEGSPDHAWVRDNLYATHAIWAMYRAYQKSADVNEDLAKANELGLTCVKTMQSLLECMMRQSNKVEQFKLYQRKNDALHAKYSAQTKNAVVGDDEWGHLQIDAISLFLLTLAQLTASGLQIVRNFDEVAFVQNLVYYIEAGYRTPDYGVWERGDKTNQGIRELNSSSVGMVKAALQALNDVGDLFGDGSKGSVIHVLPDQIQQCSALLTSMLPRESFSKETDLALLSIISYPAFAVEEQSLIQLTRQTIIDTLLGRYGCRRFLRDGYKTPLEDPSRLYYNNSELQQFEDVECEWPLSICFLMLDALFSRDDVMVEHYWTIMQDIVISDNGLRLVPELYKVPFDKVAEEKLQRGSQVREACGAIPFLWAQALYIICCLLYDGFLTPAELDPLRRRLSAYEKHPPCEVQVSILAETYEVQQELLAQDIQVQNISEIDELFCIQPPSVFARILSRLGESEKLGLTGRPLDREIGVLSTSKLYQLGQKFVIFTPQFMDQKRSYLMYDIRILMNEWSSELQYIYSSWNNTSVSGRPLIVLIVAKNMLEADMTPSDSSFTDVHMKASVIGTIKKIATGYIGGARVVMKNISDFFRTTAVSKLEFYGHNAEDLIFKEEEGAMHRNLPCSNVDNLKLIHPLQSLPEQLSLRSNAERYSIVYKTSMRHRSIMIDSDDQDLIKLYLSYGKQEQSSPNSTNDKCPPLKRFLSPEKRTSTDDLIRTSSAVSLRSTSSGDSEKKLDTAQMDEMSTADLIDMLIGTSILDEQASIVHYLWMKKGPDFDTELNNMKGATVRALMEEIYLKACESRNWSLIRLSFGLLKRLLDELSKSVTHLLVRQKQITVGMPSKNEQAITTPKTKEELHEIFKLIYNDDANSYALSQEIIVCLGSLVLTEPRLFVEMFRIRIGLIIQVLASELARFSSISGIDATQKLFQLSPFQVKSMLLLLLSGRLLEDFSMGAESGAKEQRSGLGSIRKQIEERKSRRSMIVSDSTMDVDMNALAPTDSEEIDVDEAENFQFGIWLRHRRIDGALNRVPPNFYAMLWDTVRRFPRGLSINHIVLHWGVTQEMTRREIKFALQVEEVLNQIAQPEYREIMIEALSLLSRMDILLKTDSPNIPYDQSFVVDSILRRANELFVEHNKKMETVVMECCGSGKRCDGAQGMCQYFYDSAPAGEYGTAHYLIKALMDIFIL